MTTTLLLVVPSNKIALANTSKETNYHPTTTVQVVDTTTIKAVKATITTKATTKVAKVTTKTKATTMVDTTTTVVFNTTTTKDEVGPGHPAVALAHLVATNDHGTIKAHLLQEIPHPHPVVAVPHLLPICSNNRMVVANTQVVATRLTVAVVPPRIINYVKGVQALRQVFKSLIPTKRNINPAKTSTTTNSQMMTYPSMPHHHQKNAQGSPAYCQRNYSVPRNNPSPTK